MAHPLRTEYPGALYHAFQDKDARRAYDFKPEHALEIREALLKELKRRTP